MIRAALRLIVVTCSLATCALAQAPLRSELDEILGHADTRRQEYVNAFKNFTAIETRLTELLDRNGRIEKQRTVVSDFFVYQSAFDGNELGEYRMPREVDGRPVGKPTEDAVKLFQKLARAKTSEQEFRQLRQQNLKYALRYAHWGGTLQPLAVLRNDTTSSEIQSPNSKKR